MTITRDVISDLWPVYESGEASADTKALVEEFLAQDAAFGATLRGTLQLPAVEAQMSRDTETMALQRTRDLVHGRGWLRGVRLIALVLTVFAISRVFTDTTWTTSPRTFIGDSIGAAVAWSVYLVGIHVERRRALRVNRP
jgi:hypothetical protein